MTRTNTSQHYRPHELSPYHINSIITRILREGVVCDVRRREIGKDTDLKQNNVIVQQKYFTSNVPDSDDVRRYISPKYEGDKTGKRRNVGVFCTQRSYDELLHLFHVSPFPTAIGGWQNRTRSSGLGRYTWVPRSLEHPHVQQ